MDSYLTPKRFVDLITLGLFWDLWVPQERRRAPMNIAIPAYVGWTSVGDVLDKLQRIGVISGAQRRFIGSFEGLDLRRALLRRCAMMVRGRMNAVNSECWLLCFTTSELQSISLKTIASKRKIGILATGAARALQLEPSYVSVLTGKQYLKAAA
ncbi:MAG TPA: hypothetical protein VMV50_00325 [Candidatus Paceibacterota bacterium]|nr:hypothetical protein [Candidatus Paceibacterota bacterium]